MSPDLTRTPIMEVTEEKEIVDMLKSHDLNEVASRLVQLREIIAEDPDETDLVIESMRSFAEFILQETHLPVPEIGAGPEGYVEAEWRIPSSGGRKAASDESYWGRGDGILAMKFLPTGLVRFAATSGPAGQGKERLRTSGILPRNSILPAVQTFISRLAVL